MLPMLPAASLRLSSRTHAVEFTSASSLIFKSANILTLRTIALEERYKESWKKEGSGGGNLCGYKSFTFFINFSISTRSVLFFFLFFIA